MRNDDFPLGSIANLYVYSTMPADAPSNESLTKFVTSGMRTWAEVGQFMLQPFMAEYLWLFSTYVPCHGVQIMIATKALEPYRMALARNQFLGIEAQRKLAEDSVVKVRYNLAGNTETSSEVLAFLALDPHPFVQRDVRRNPSTPAHLKPHLIQMPNTGV
jgi:hypothetical protein